MSNIVPGQYIYVSRHLYPSRTVNSPILLGHLSEYFVFSMLTKPLRHPGEPIHVNDHAGWGAWRASNTFLVVDHWHHYQAACRR